MKCFVLIDAVVCDLDDSWFQIGAESGSVEPAEQVIWRVHEALVTLAGNPKIGRPCKKNIHPKGNWLAVDKFTVYYRAATHRIIITHFFTAEGIKKSMAEADASTCERKDNRRGAVNRGKLERPDGCACLRACEAGRRSVLWLAWRFPDLGIRFA